MFIHRFKPQNLQFPDDALSICFACEILLFVKSYLLNDMQCSLSKLQFKGLINLEMDLAQQDKRHK